MRSLDIRPDDLERRFARSILNITDADISAFTQRGLPCRAIGADDIAAQKGGLWTREFGGKRAFILPCRAPCGNLVDLIAFRLESPKVFWRFTGHGEALGWDVVDSAVYDHKPLRLYDTPIAWLAGEGKNRAGACILDWKRYWVGRLAGVAALRVDGPEFGFQVRERLKYPFAPPPIEVAS